MPPEFWDQEKIHCKLDHSNSVNLPKQEDSPPLSSICTSISQQKSCKSFQIFSKILPQKLLIYDQKLQVCNIYPASTPAAYNDLNQEKTGASLCHSNLPGAAFLYWLLEEKISI